MLACAQWLADDYLIDQGFTLSDTPQGRVATRGHLAYPLPPACEHPDCPPRSAPVDERRAA